MGSGEEWVKEGGFLRGWEGRDGIPPYWGGWLGGLFEEEGEEDLGTSNRAIYKQGWDVAFVQQAFRKVKQGAGEAVFHLEFKGDDDARFKDGLCIGGPHPNDTGQGSIFSKQPSCQQGAWIDADELEMIS